MITQKRRHRRRIVVAVLAVAATSALPALSASAANVSQLQIQLGQTQSQLNSTKSREHTLDSKISELNGQVSTLAGQVSLVRSREQAAAERLAAENDLVQTVRAQTVKQRRRLALLRKILSRARRALAAELVSQYEQPQQSFVTLVVDSGGFQQLLDGLQYMSRAKRAEETIVRVTRAAQSEAITASERLLALEAADTRAVDNAQTQTHALAGMNALLSSRESALTDERSAQSAALAASQARGAKLDAAISAIQAQEAAAEAAARAVTVPSDGGAGTSLTTVTGGSGGWAIPYPVVLCESGGQDLPPNGAGASGYYQIVPATWRDFGGSGPAAYLAPKAEQDAVAAKIWNNGAGASNWTCSGIVGIT
jgi:septal ring factor EnvC (AmiA/AmiB activator)